jgi:hypothetical protein
MVDQFKNIVRDIGLDPSRLADKWAVYEDGFSTWLASRHLESATLEIYDPSNDRLVTRWDIDVVYASVGSGQLWVDTDAVRYAILKAGKVPSSCNYTIKVQNKPGRPDVAGWVPCSFRSTDGLVPRSLGSTLGGTDLSGRTRYWSKS